MPRPGGQVEGPGRAAFGRHWIALALVFYACLVLSAGLFLLRPQAFYWRAWEYFDDIVYRNQGVAPVWEGREGGDLARDYCLRYQEPRRTRVTVDQDGFRSTPDLPGPYRILVAGDSTIFGSGLSDDETLPWALSERLGVKVFNGARQELGKVLARPDLRKARLVVEGRTERVLDAHVFTGPLRLEPYAPLRRGEERGLWQSAPFELYFFPAVADRLARRLRQDVFSLLGPPNPEAPYLFFRSHKVFTPRDLEDAVKIIKARQEALAGLGYVYVFLPVPAKQTIYRRQVDPYTRSYIPSLTRALEAAGVPALDLIPVFNRHRGDRLYPIDDTHWNGRGSTLAARELAVFLRARGLLAAAGGER